ncbi:MAG: 30S ribosomal protein S4 [Deltaproteobacteria bacterium]|nr:30S ribosomal protein S4 [Deltaproteobacteria bacterium]
MSHAVCRFCRREGLKLFLKGERCYTDKCAIERRNYPPGMHGRRRGKFSEYSIRLREKQKVKRIYDLEEGQFRGFYEEAERLKGNTGENLIILLERRLDSVVYRLGFASSRRDARQMVLHNHIEVNDKRVNISSYLVSKGDVVKVAESDKEMLRVKGAIEGLQRREIPKWLELDQNKLSGTVVESPTRSAITFPIEEHLIVEYYSR